MSQCQWCAKRKYKRSLFKWASAARRCFWRVVPLRLTVHKPQAQVSPIQHGIPWLGFVIYLTHRRLKARNVVKFTRRLQANWADYCNGQISFAEFDASVQGWINHVRYADTWGLRTHLLGKGLVHPASD